MKISNSKKELARIINENGGWREVAQFSAQDKDGEVFHYATKPSIEKGSEVWGHKGCIGYGEFEAQTLPNWHQTILSRDEYFHLYPVLDADVAIAASFNPCVDGFEVGGVIAQHTNSLISESNVAQHTPRITAVTTIEQLAADYKTKLDIATRAQEEADSHRCGAEVALSKVEIALKELGFKIEPITAKQEPELVITDWRDLQAGDEVEASYREIERVVGTVLKIDVGDNNQPIFVSDGVRSIWATKFRFIRRP